MCMTLKKDRFQFSLRLENRVIKLIKIILKLVIL